MRVRLDKDYELISSPQDFDLEMDISRLLDHSMIREIQETRLKCRVINENGINFRVKGMLVVDLLVVCSSCTKEFRHQFSFDFEEVFSKELAIDELDLDFDDKEIDIDDYLDPSDEINLIENDIIDLKSVVEELVEINLPLRVTCSQDCKGLCPVCGMDRNNSLCDCNTDRIDPRMAVLADLLKDK